MEALLALLLLAVVPFVILGVALKVLFALIFLPFKIVGGLFTGAPGARRRALRPGREAGSASCSACSSCSSSSSFCHLAPLLLLEAVVWLALKAFSPSGAAGLSLSRVGSATCLVLAEGTGRPPPGGRSPLTEL